MLSQAPAAAMPGHLDSPLLVSEFPFDHWADTRLGESVVDTYACAPSTSEHGPELVYRLEVAQPGRLTGVVEGDDGTVDIDVHLLSSLDLDASSQATSCLARGHRWAEADVEAGVTYVVVDSWEGPERAGPYHLRLDFQPTDDWYERPVAQGVTLRTRRYAELFGEAQTGSVLEIDLDHPGVRVRPLPATGCQTTSQLGSEAGAIAAINGGFFAAGCVSVSLLKVDGELLATNSTTRSAFGLDRGETPMIALVDAGADWPEAEQAIGGVPRLASGGAADVRSSEEGVGSSFTDNPHPRTAVGIDADGDRGHLILATVDGRTAAGGGMTLGELAQWMVWLGSLEAVNLDGGGSTTMWVAGEPFGGVINYPSDNGEADHEGERAVGSGLGVFAPALDRPPVWLTRVPGGRALVEGETWRYEAAAADPEGLAPSWSLGGDVLDGPIVLDDLGQGWAELALTPSWRDGRAGVRTVILEVGAGDGPGAEQVIELEIAFIDDDDDGMADSWEILVGLDPDRDDAGDDPDRDGRGNLDEFLDDTDPWVADGPAELAPDSPPDAGSEGDGRAADADRPETSAEEPVDGADADSAGDRGAGASEGEDEAGDGSAGQAHDISSDAGCGCVASGPARSSRGAALGVWLLVFAVLRRRGRGSR